MSFHKCKTSKLNFANTFSSSFFLVIFKETNNNSNKTETEKYWQHTEAAKVTVLNTILAKFSRNWQTNFKPVRSKLVHYILMIPSFIPYSVILIWKLPFHLNTLDNGLVFNSYLILFPGVDMKLLVFRVCGSFSCTPGNVIFCWFLWKRQALQWLNSTCRSTGAPRGTFPWNIPKQIARSFS